MIRNNLKSEAFYTKGIELMNKKAECPVRLFEDYKKKKPDVKSTSMNRNLISSGWLPKWV